MILRLIILRNCKQSTIPIFMKTFDNYRTMGKKHFSSSCNLKTITAWDKFRRYIIIIFLNNLQFKAPWRYQEGWRINVLCLIFQMVSRYNCGVNDLHCCSIPIFYPSKNLTQTLISNKFYFLWKIRSAFAPGVEDQIIDIKNDELDTRMRWSHFVKYFQCFAPDRNWV